MRRSTLAAVAAFASFVLVLGGCSGDDDDGSDTTSTTTEATTEAETTTAPEAEDAEVDCEAYGALVELFANVEEIATGSSDGQVAADQTLEDSIAALAPSAEGDDIATEALDTLGQVSFQVTDDAEAGPSSDEVDVALATIEDAWAETCAPPTEGATTTVPVEGEGATECPAPEVLEAEGFTCDSEGNLTPVDEETVGECPAPEVLEAEGFTCDSEGNLTPVEGEGGETTEAGEPTECPAPEVLEAEGYECDSEGNLTPIEE